MFPQSMQRLAHLLFAFGCGSFWTAATTASAFAAYYGGSGVEGGVSAAADAGVSGSTDLEQLIKDIVQKVLSYVALAAVIAIIIAGLYLILGMGNDSAKETAKKIIIYVIIGLIVIIASAGIANIVLES